MDQSTAARCLIASQDDPRLAAWVFLINEFKLPPEADVAAGDHWQAYEGLFNHGLVSAAQYDRDGAYGELVGYRPAPGDVQSALANLAILSTYELQENAMDKDRALARVSTPQGLSRLDDDDDDLSLGPRRSDVDELDLFEDRPRPRAVQAPEPRYEMKHEDFRHLPRGYADSDIVESMTCLRRGCGAEVPLEVVHQDSDASLSGMPTATIHEYIVKGSCSHCGAEYTNGIDIVIRGDGG